MSSLADLYASVFRAAVNAPHDVAARVDEALRAEQGGAAAVVPFDVSGMIIPKTMDGVKKVAVPTARSETMKRVFAELYNETSGASDATKTFTATRPETEAGYAVGWGLLLVNRMRTGAAASVLSPQLPEMTDAVRDLVQQGWDARKADVAPPLVELRPDAPKYTEDIAATTLEEAMGAVPGVSDDKAGRPPMIPPVDPVKMARARDLLRSTRGAGAAVALEDLRRSADEETRRYNDVVKVLFDTLEGPDVRASEKNRTKLRNIITGMDQLMTQIGPGIARTDGVGATAAMMWAGLAEDLSKVTSDVIGDMSQQSDKDVDSDGSPACRLRDDPGGTRRADGSRQHAALRARRACVVAQPPSREGQ